jgi:hypothetical protein
MRCALVARDFDLETIRRSTKVARPLQVFQKTKYKVDKGGSKIA